MTGFLKIVDQSFERFVPTSPPSDTPTLKGGGGDGTSGLMEGRVSKLETHMEYARRDLDQLVDGQKAILAKLNDLPTKSDLNTFRWQWVATAAAAIALVVGGIIGGLSWIAPDPAPPPPIIVTIPK